MEMPKVQEQHRKLHALAGDWSGEEKIYPSPWDPKGGGATASYQARVDLEEFFVVADYSQERGGRITYRGHGVYGYDAGSGNYTMHWFDSMGAATPAPARGRWEGNRLAFENESPMGRSRYSYVFEGSGRLLFTIENSQDGKTWSTFLEGRYTRR